MAVGYAVKSSTKSMSWLATSREHTNFSYDLTDLNKNQLAWFVAQIRNKSVNEIRGYIHELDSNDSFRDLLAQNAMTSPRRHVMDAQILYGRRLGWYALVRVLRPATLVETGTDRGLGTAVLALATDTNAMGHVYTIDINPDAGYLFRGTYLEKRITRLTGSSLKLIQTIPGEVDFFIHDSDHSEGYERDEIESVAKKLAPTALVLSDNSQATTVLSTWAERSGQNFAYFQEIPKDHWWPGDGIGAAWHPTRERQVPG
jgi:predicted O-methyltransferase YrrM